MHVNICHLYRSVHSGVLDGLQLDISHPWTALHLPFPATTVLSDGMFPMAYDILISTGDENKFAGSISVSAHGSLGFLVIFGHQADL